MSQARDHSPTLYKAPLRARWKAEDAREVLAQVDRSGLSASEFAAGAGLDPERLYRWRARLHGKGAERARFVEVVASAQPCWVEVVSPSGHVVRLPDVFNEDTLRKVLAVLDERSGRC